jgi:dihydroorotase
MRTYDWLIRGGRVIDPANQVDAVLDVGITAGRISAVETKIEPAQAEHTYDASRKIVIPGLIDLHIHGYHLATPLGIPVDHYCLGRGVTTAIDAGSAGCSTFPGFRAFAIERNKTRLLAFLHISCSGLSFGGLGGDISVPGELDSLKLVNVARCVECVELNRDVIVGVKVRLSASIGDDGRNEAEAYRRALKAARAVQLPLMVHHVMSSVPLEDCPGQMERGDIYTHTYHGFDSTILEPVTRQLHPAVIEARGRGVLFDVGHGQGSFNWTVAELCARNGFWPDTISTDLHSGTCEGPAYDMPTVMTRLLHAGMPLGEVVAASTSRAAKAIGWQDRIGTLGVGREADVAVLSIESVDLQLEDCQSQMRHIHQKLTPQAVWRSGVPASLTQPKRLPNPVTIASQRKWSKHLAIRDEAFSETPSHEDTKKSATQTS